MNRIESGGTGEAEILTENQKLLSDKLFEIGAVKFGDFLLNLHDKYPEAPLSPIYMDLRMLQRFPDALNIAVDTYADMVKPLEFDLIAPIPNAATPVGSVLANYLSRPMITPRMEQKKHGTGAKIDGLLESDKGKHVIVIDDLITEAGSKFKAIDVLHSQDLIVTDIVVLIDREQGGKQELEKNGYSLHSALALNQILEYYLKTSRIDPEQYIDTINRIEMLNHYLKT